MIVTLNGEGVDGGRKRDGERRDVATLDRRARTAGNQEWSSADPFIYYFPVSLRRYCYIQVLFGDEPWS